MIKKSAIANPSCISGNFKTKLVLDLLHAQVLSSLDRIASYITLFYTGFLSLLCYPLSLLVALMLRVGTNGLSAGIGNGHGRLLPSLAGK